MPMFTQLFQNAQQQALITAKALLATGVLTDELGNPLTCDVRNEESPSTLLQTVCYVTTDPGSIGMTKDYGVTGMDDTGSNLAHVLTAMNSKLVFTFYTNPEPQRRYLADWFIWNLCTGFTVQGGVRVDGYYLESLRNGGIIPDMANLFDKVEYPPADTRAEERPFGLPYRAILRLNCWLQAAWTTPPFSPSSAVATITPNNAPGNIGPPTSITFT